MANLMSYGEWARGQNNSSSPGGDGFGRSYDEYLQMFGGGSGGSSPQQSQISSYTYNNQQSALRNKQIADAAKSKADALALQKKQQADALAQQKASAKQQAEYQKQLAAQRSELEAKIKSLSSAPSKPVSIQNSQGTTSVKNGNVTQTLAPAAQKYQDTAQAGAQANAEALGKTSPERDAQLKEYQKTFVDELTNNSSTRLKQQFADAGLLGSSLQGNALNELNTKAETQGILQRDQLRNTDEENKRNNLGMFDNILGRLANQSLATSGQALDSYFQQAGMDTQKNQFQASSLQNIFNNTQQLGLQNNAQGENARQFNAQNDLQKQQFGFDQQQYFDRMLGSSPFATPAAYKGGF